MGGVKRIRKSTPSFSLITFIRALMLVLCAGLFLGLVYSVFLSGYRYQFDIDEMFYAQFNYLYARGMRPYLDVYTQVYPPIFSWLMTPAFRTAGFTSFDGLYLGRLIMIGLLVIRLGAVWFTLRTLFSKRAATFFLPLFLFDPFAVFTTMQFRPDNLMLTFFSLGLLFFTRGFIRGNKRSIDISAVWLSLAVITLPKIAPTVAIISVIFAVYCIVRKRTQELGRFIFFGAIPVGLFTLYLVMAGSLGEMIQQTFIDIRSLYTNFKYPLPINTMMRPDNIFIFGTMGKPATWVYLWLIAPLGLTGAYHVVYEIARRGEIKARESVKLMLILSFLSQWAVLFSLQVTFMQHYMPFHWLAAVFAAYALDELLTVTRQYAAVYRTLSVVVFVLYVILAKSSIQNNISRSTISGKDQRDYYTAKWKQIPADAAVFPGFLFRPSSYPLPYGGFIVNLPQNIIDRLPDIPAMLESKRPVVLLDDYTISRLPASALVYISDHYEHVPGETELMRRKP